MAGSASESCKGTTGPAVPGPALKHPKPWKGPAWPQLGGPRSPTAPNQAPSSAPCTHKPRTRPGAVFGGVFADQQLPWVSSLSSLAQVVDEPGNLGDIFGINKCKRLNLNSSSWNCLVWAPQGTPSSAPEGDGGEEERWRENCRGVGMGRGKARRMMWGKEGASSRRGIWEITLSQACPWVLRRCLHVQAPEFPRQALISAVPHVPLQERNSRSTSRALGAAPPWLRFIQARLMLCKRPFTGCPCPPSCSPHPDTELAVATRAGDSWQHGTGWLCLQEMLPAVPSVRPDANISSYSADFQHSPLVRPKKLHVINPTSARSLPKYTPG